MSAYEQGKENAIVNVALTPLEQPKITGLKLRSDIILGDFIFNTIDEYNVVWVITDIKGWFQHPSADMPDIPRGFGDGSYDVQGRYAARDITLEGVFLTPTPSLVEAARDRLVEATNLVYRGVWLKTGTNPLRASFCRLSGSVEIQTTTARGRTEFSIGLRAADPIKYLWDDTNPEGYQFVEIPVSNINSAGTGSGVVENVGNYTVPCTLEIIGPLTAPATIFNETTDELLIITQGLKGSIAAPIVNKQLTFNQEVLKDIATLTTSVEHKFTAGDSVFISGVGGAFDGEFVLLSTPTTTTFTYETEAASIKNVLAKSLVSSVATLETTQPHGFNNGDQITVTAVDGTFDGTYTVVSTPSVSSLTYAKTRVPPRSVVSTTLTGNTATLSTSDVHEFISGESVTVSGIDVNYNGVRTIIATPTPNSFTYAATRTNAREVSNKVMVSDEITLTTTAPHGFIVNEPVNIVGIDITFNGGYVVGSIPTASTFTYKRVRSTSKSVLIKSLTANVATITTSEPHGYLAGESVTVEGVDATFNGTYTIIALPSNTTFTYAKTSADIAPTSVDSSGFVKSSSRRIASSSLTNNVATITTTNSHGVLTGEVITISNLNATYNGTYNVLSVPNLNSFTYSKVNADIPLANAAAGAFVAMSGNVTSAAVVSTGLATVNGILPTAAATGVATVSANIPRVASAGEVIKKNDVQFTPGVSGASAVLPADVLEINTQDREVSFNGETEGARARVEVLADFIKLSPGNNIINFNDGGNSEGTATLRISYRSGWLA